MVNDLGSMDDLELMPLGGGYMVRRERLMNELLAKGRKAGIVVLYAPDGFGKTSVLLQYTHEVKCNPTRGPVRIIEADRAIGREVFMQLEVVTEELKDKPHSLIAIDNVPNLDQHIARLLSAYAGRARARLGIADGSVWPRRRSRSARKRDCQRIWRGTCRSGFARQ